LLRWLYTSSGAAAVASTVLQPTRNATCVGLACLGSDASGAELAEVSDPLGVVELAELLQLVLHDQEGLANSVLALNFGRGELTHRVFFLLRLVLRLFKEAGCILIRILVHGYVSYIVGLDVPFLVGGFVHLGRRLLRGVLHHQLLEEFLDCFGRVEVGLFQRVEVVQDLLVEAMFTRVGVEGRQLFRKFLVEIPSFCKLGLFICLREGGLGLGTDVALAARESHRLGAESC